MAYVIEVGEIDRSGHRDLRYRIETLRPDPLRDLLEEHGNMKLGWPLTEGVASYRFPGRRGFLGMLRRSSAVISIELRGDTCCVELHARRVHYLPDDGGFIGYLADEDLTHSGARYWWKVLTQQLGIRAEEEAKRAR